MEHTPDPAHWHDRRYEPTPTAWLGPVTTDDGEHDPENDAENSAALSGRAAKPPAETRAALR
jgi:hypothetical protein